MEVSESNLGVLLRELALESKEICGDEPRELPVFFPMFPWSISTAWREMDLKEVLCVA